MAWQNKFEALGPDNAIWDDGEWVGWHQINSTLADIEIKEKYPLVEPDMVRMFDRLVEDAQEYYFLTGRNLPIYGELGELFAEIRFGLKRHPENTAGSDGKIGNDWIEVKTITPTNKHQRTSVKRQGNFNKLLVVKINEDFTFKAALLSRKSMPKGNSRIVHVDWSKEKIKWD